MLKRKEEIQKFNSLFLESEENEEKVKEEEEEKEEKEEEELNELKKRYENLTEEIRELSEEELEEVTGGSATSPLDSINPSDIVSMEVLKDAFSTAIYGSQGSNGLLS